LAAWARRFRRRRRRPSSADGKEDYVLDGGSVGCEGFASLYGDREKGVTVYVGDGKGGAKQAFSDMTYGMKIEATVRPKGLVYDERRRLRQEASGGFRQRGVSASAQSCGTRRPRRSNTLRCRRSR